MASAVERISTDSRYRPMSPIVPDVAVGTRKGAACSAPSRARLCNGKSSHRLQQLPCFTQQIPNPLALRNGVVGEQAVPARIVVSFLCARALRSAVHAAARLAAHRRRAARSAGAGFGAATWARQHRTNLWCRIAQACALRSGLVATRQPRTIIRRGRADSTSMSGFSRLVAAEQHRWQAISGSKLPNVVMVPVICPTCQNVFRRSGPQPVPRIFAWARFRVFWLGPVNAALRCTFCGLKPQAERLIEGRHARARRFGRHRLDWSYGEFGSEISTARGRRRNGRAGVAGVGGHRDHVVACDVGGARQAA